MKKKIKDLTINEPTMLYKLGVENCYGHLLAVKEFNRSDDLWNYIVGLKEKYIKSGDLQTPTLYVQVYFLKNGFNFENCISQFKLTNENI